MYLCKLNTLNKTLVRDNTEIEEINEDSGYKSKEDSEYLEDTEFSKTSNEKRLKEDNIRKDEISDKDLVNKIIEKIRDPEFLRRLNSRLEDVEFYL